MKQCTVCRTSYTDDSLRYCLADGGSLVAIPDETETVVRPGVRVDVDGPALNPRNTQTPSQNRGGTSTVLKVVIALVLIGFLGLMVLGAAGVLYYLNSASAVATASPTPSRTPVSTPSPETTATPNDDSEDLEKEIAALQKKLEEMVNAAPGKSSPNNVGDDGTAMAVVNSPNDGFLALRDAPDAESGSRLAKIPHGTVVTLENCEKEQVTISGRTGRWCMVTYDDQTGWVFDAWLIY